MSNRHQSRVRTNGRRPIKASSLPAYQLVLYPDDLELPPLVACSGCGKYWSVCRGGVLHPHRTGDGQTYPGSKKLIECPGSRQPVIVDLDFQQWQTRLRQAGQNHAHSTRVQRTGKPSAPAAVTQLAAARSARLAAAGIR